MRRILLCLFVVISACVWADLKIGFASGDLTPPIGTPSAGYQARKGQAMVGVRDPLLANAMVVDNEESVLAFCSVDHLGFDRSMVGEVRAIVQECLNGKEIDIFIGSTHTHSGGGSFLNYPFIGEAIAGKFDPAVRHFYIQQTAQAIVEAFQNRQDAKLGIGYGALDGLNQYRGKAPTTILPRNIVTVIKITTLNDQPLGVLFNFPCHPVILPFMNQKFSADFVGSARIALNETFKSPVTALFFNGAQADVNPDSQYINQENYDQQCDVFGQILAKKVCEIWNTIEAKTNLSIEHVPLEYSFDVKPTSQGLTIPIKQYFSELNIIVLDKKHAFLTVPGELSCIYDHKLRTEGLKYFEELSILGLVNDAHGYILTPEAWDFNSPECTKSFGGREYGPYLFRLACSLLMQTGSQDPLF